MCFYFLDCYFVCGPLNLVGYGIDEELVHVAMLG